MTTPYEQLKKERQKFKSKQERIEKKKEDLIDSSIQASLGNKSLSNYQ